MNNSLPRPNLWGFVFCSLLAYVLLVVSYRYVIVERNYYSQLLWDFSEQRFIVGIFLVLGGSFAGLYALRAKLLLLFFFQVLWFFSILPCVVLWACSGSADELLVGTFMGAAVFVASGIAVSSVLTKFRFGLFSEGLAVGSVILAILSIFFLLAYWGAFGYVSLNDVDIYRIRAELSAAMPPVYEYLHPILGKALLPLLLVIACARKSYAALVFVVILFGLLFLATYHKAPLFYPAALLAAYWILSKRYGFSLFCFGYCLVLVIALMNLGGWCDLLFDDLMLRRVIFVPAFLNVQYFEFSLDMPHVLWSDSKVTLGLMQYPFDKAVPYLIGERIGMPKAHANTGWVGSGFIQAGWVGVIIYAVILGMVLGLFSKISEKEMNLPVVGSLLFLPIFWAMVSSDLPSIFLTHGLMVLLVMCALVRWRFVEASGR